MANLIPEINYSTERDSLEQENLKGTLCCVCQTFRIQNLRSGASFACGTMAEVIESAQLGCVLCFMVCEQLKLNIPSEERRERYRADNIFLKGIRRRVSDEEKAAGYYEGDIENLEVESVPSGRGPRSITGQLALLTTEGDPAAVSLRRRPSITDLSSDATFHSIQNWLFECTESHPTCGAIQDVILPTRVLDVGPSDNLQDPSLFHPPNNLKGRYVALSYCWGGQREAILTKQRLDDHQLEFPMQTLPATFRDAIDITRRLGFQYLWIDALCIVQEGDNGDDFQREGARMDLVYGRAAITIAAGATENISQGIFGAYSSNSASEKIKEAFIPYDLPDSSIGKAYLRPESPTVGEQYVYEPLNTRGWTFQERILSPRVVIYHSDQISWGCRTKIANSRGPLNPNSRVDSRTISVPSRHTDRMDVNLFTDSDIRLQGPTKARLMTYWTTLVQDYSERALTYPQDKLKAMSSLARLVQRRTGDTYAAGLWASTLKTQLLWIYRSSISKDEFVFPSTYRAPSWSWASIDGRVTYEYPLSPNKIAERKWLLDIIDYHTSPSTDLDTLGEVIDGYIKLIGPLKFAERDSEGVCGGLFAIDRPDNTHFLRIDGAYANPIFTVDNFTGLWCLGVAQEMAQTESPKDPVTVCTYVLLLVSTGSQDTFKRVGVVVLRHSERWFDDAPREVITLV